MDLLLVVPPVIKPCEPSLGALALARALREHGAEVGVLDANIGWFEHALQQGRLKRLLAEHSAALDPRRRVAASRALAHLERGRPSLKAARTFQSVDRYNSAVGDLEALLELCSLPFPGQRVRTADFTAAGRRATASGDLRTYAQGGPTPFDDYAREVLLPAIRERAARFVGFSLTYLNQALPVARLAWLVRRELPAQRLLLGGALLDSWSGCRLQGGLFDLFEGLFTALPEDLARLGGLLGLPQEPALAGPLLPDLADLAQASYLAPAPIVPAAAGLGCYWGKCSFCPDGHRRPRREGQAADLADFAEAVAERFPGALLHLTDSAVPPAHLGALAQRVAEKRLPLRWYSFIRAEQQFAYAQFVQLLARGGCALLQVGLESGSARLLERMHKGIDLDCAGRLCENTRAAGIPVYLYLLFGFPGEEESDRQATLDFVVRHSGGINYLNNSLFNLPLTSPMAQEPAAFGISAMSPFTEEGDLSLYADFTCGERHPRTEGRRFLEKVFTRHPAVAPLVRATPRAFKSNLAPFFGRAVFDR